jgi:hypothetical protein
MSREQHWKFLQGGILLRISALLRYLVNFPPAAFADFLFKDVEKGKH